jgi:hypothetical protein
MAEQATNKATPDAATRLLNCKDAVVIHRRGVGRWPGTCGGTLQKGARAVVLVDRHAVLAEEIAGGLRNNSTKVTVYKVDVSDLTEVQRVVTETV